MRKVLFSLVCLQLLIACGEDDPTQVDSFNRKEVVEHMVDELILPSYSDFTLALGDLNDAITAYRTAPTATSLENLKTTWLEAYLAYQDAALWSFGPAEDHGLLTVCNVYPTDTAQILQNLQGSYDLNSISQFDAQGFPALEYLLYGSSINWSNAAVIDYFEAIARRMTARASNVENDWSTFRSTFINAEGTDQGSALGMLFNHTFLPYFEVQLREYKFGIPGGQRTGTPLPGNVEGPFSRVHSKDLALRAFEAYRRAWTGIGHASHNSGPSIASYIAYMDQRNGTQLEGKLLNQLDDIQLAIENLDADFYSIAETNPQQLNDVWAKHQLLVFTVKTEISSALNVTISYVDSDGD